MKNAISTRLFLTIALLFVINLNRLHAQSPAGAPASVTMKVRGLTSDGRDAIVRSLGGDLRLVFACVPAGILVFEADGARDHGTLRDKALQRAEQHVRRQDITELNIGRAEAEEQCAQARNR